MEDGREGKERWRDGKVANDLLLPLLLAIAVGSDVSRPVDEFKAIVATSISIIIIIIIVVARPYRDEYDIVVTGEHVVVT
jgi:hypothetical protein